MKEAANRRPYYVVCFFSGFTLIAFSMAALAAFTASCRLGDTPVLGFRPGIRTVHCQPAGLMVWTRLYSVPLCSVGRERLDDRLGSPIGTQAAAKMNLGTEG
jgi:hypothetical protein